VNPQGSGANGLGECRLVVVHVAGWGPEPVPLVSTAPTVPDAGLADKPADALLVTAASPTGQRYIHHREEGSTVHLFLRKTKTTETGGTPPFLYAGPMTYESHTGERPMRILWRLEHELPASVLEFAVPEEHEA